MSLFYIFSASFLVSLIISTISYSFSLENFSNVLLMWDIPFQRKKKHGKTFVWVQHFGIRCSIIISISSSPPDHSRNPRLVQMATKSYYYIACCVRQNPITPTTHQQQGRTINPDQSDINYTLSTHTESQSCLCVSSYRSCCDLMWVSMCVRPESHIRW